MSLPVIQQTHHEHPHPAKSTLPPIGKIEVDRNLCIGAESCAVIAPEVFKMDHENIAVVLDPKGTDDETILQAAQSCPVAAVILYDLDGNQIYP